jgi:hypothetical protein
MDGSAGKAPHSFTLVPPRARTPLFSAKLTKDHDHVGLGGAVKGRKEREGEREVSEGARMDRGWNERGFPGVCRRVCRLLSLPVSVSTYVSQATCGRGGRGEREERVGEEDGEEEKKPPRVGERVRRSTARKARARKARLPAAPPLLRPFTLRKPSRPPARAVI